MKRVVIGMDNGRPYVIGKPSGIEVIFKPEKNRTWRKVWRTWIYRLTSLR